METHPFPSSRFASGRRWLLGPHCSILFVSRALALITNSRSEGFRTSGDGVDAERWLGLDSSLHRALLSDPHQGLSILFWKRRRRLNVEVHDPRRRSGRAGARRGSCCVACYGASRRLTRPPAWRPPRQAAAFRSGKISVSLLTILWPGNPSSSAGWLPRLIQKVIKPKDEAPATSQELDETKPVASGAVPSFLDANWYTRGLGL